MAQTPTRLRPYSRMGLTSTPMIVGRQKANSTYVIGAPVFLDGSGYVAAATVAASLGAGNVVSGVTVAIAGFVAENGAASSSDTTNVTVHAAVEGMEFIGHVISAASASSNAKLAQTDVGAVMFLAKQNSDTHWGVIKHGNSSFAAGTHVDVVVTRLVDAASTVNGRVAFMIKDDWRQLAST